MSAGRWIVDDGRAVFLTDDGDGVEVAEVYDTRTPLQLRLAAVGALHALIRSAADTAPGPDRCDAGS